jgi:hypothetical protein
MHQTTSRNRARPDLPTLTYSTSFAFVHPIKTTTNIIQACNAAPNRLLLIHRNHGLYNDHHSMLSLELPDWSRYTPSVIVTVATSKKPTFLRHDKSPRLSCRNESFCDEGIDAPITPSGGEGQCHKTSAVATALLTTPHSLNRRGCATLRPTATTAGTNG